MAHKVISTVVAVVVIVGGYYTYTALTAATVVASMTETGQVSASSNISVLSQSSGEILSIPVTAGQHVVAGQALATIDPTTAEQNVTSAEEALQAAQISLATEEQNISQSRSTGYEDVSSAFLNLSSVMTGLITLLHGSTVPGHLTQTNEDAYTNMTEVYDASIPESESLTESAYQKAYASYTQAIADFKATPRTADDATIAALINESYGAVTDLSDALRAATNFLDSVNTALQNQNSSVPSTLTSNISTLMGYTTTTKGYATSLSNDISNLAVNSQQSAGADPLAIQSSKLSLQEKQDALAQAEQALADTVVRAPFSGTVGALSVQQYQTIGSGTAVATLVSDNQNVNISVNEVDAAKLKVGEKATLTFDALPNVSIAGTVASVNTIGTVSSGVVSYAAVVTFDTPNPSVKPGMSATASIITGTESGLVLPQSAVKATNGQSYVLTFNPPLANSTGSTGAIASIPPTRTIVTTGLSDNSNIIIEKGVSAGAQVVTKTVVASSATTASTAAQSTSILGGARTGGAGLGGGAFRALTP
jgi:RND family efflux transporter MFP subunit